MPKTKKEGMNSYMIAIMGLVAIIIILVFMLYNQNTRAPVGNAISLTNIQSADDITPTLDAATETIYICSDQRCVPQIWSSNDPLYKQVQNVNRCHAYGGGVYIKEKSPALLV